MVQQRFLGKNQWYHETQSSPILTNVQPLAVDAIHVNDRFLLDLQLSDLAITTETPWLATARMLSHTLLPDQVATNKLQTLSHYERLSTALTVAQVFGVQRLCNYYAARLAPESCGDSSRETNRRLTLITQHSRILASQPTYINEQSLIQLDECGLSIEDIITFSQLIGFIGFQACTLAVLHAIHRLSVRQIPGITEQQEANTEIFSHHTVTWQPTFIPSEHRLARIEPVSILQKRQVPLFPYALANLLTIDTITYHKLEQLTHFFWPTNQPLSDDDLLVIMLVSRINGSAACFNDAVSAWQGSHDLPNAIRHGKESLNSWSDKHPREKAIIQAVQRLTRAPQKFDYSYVVPLFEQGFTEQQALRLLVGSGLAGWLNRLKIGLGHTHQE